MSNEKVFPHNLFMFERQDNLYWIEGKWQYPPIYYNGAYYLGGSIKDCPVMKPFSYEETTYAMGQWIIFDGGKMTMVDGDISLEEYERETNGNILQSHKSNN